MDTGKENAYEFLTNEKLMKMLNFKFGSKPEDIKVKAPYEIPSPGH